MKLVNFFFQNNLLLLRLGHWDTCFGAFLATIIEIYIYKHIIFGACSMSRSYFKHKKNVSLEAARLYLPLGGINLIFTAHNIACGKNQIPRKLLFFLYKTNINLRSRYSWKHKFKIIFCFKIVWCFLKQNFKYSGPD